MNSFDVTIRFQFDDDDLTEELTNVLNNPANKPEFFFDTYPSDHTGFGRRHVQLSLNGMSFDDVVVPFPEPDAADTERQTDLLLSFSTVHDSGIRALIMELVDSALQAKCE